MMLVRDSNTDFGLLPLAILFIGLPAYAVLLLAAYAGRVLAARG
jgi:hypothetical protein